MNYFFVILEELKQLYFLLLTITINSIFTCFFWRTMGKKTGKVLLVNLTVHYLLLKLPQMDILHVK